MKKNPAAYQVSRSAVKNTHMANKGIEKVRHVSPATTKYRGFLSITRRTNTIKNKIS